MTRRVALGLALVPTFACAPGAIGVDGDEGPTSSGTSESTDTDDPPAGTCEASVFVLDDTVEYVSNIFAPPVPIVVRGDGSVVAVHVFGDASPEFRMRTWNGDGGLVWDQLFPGVGIPTAHSTLERDDAGDLYFGHADGTFEASMYVTKFAGSDGAASWTYDAGEPGNSPQSVEELRFDGGRLLAALRINHSISDTDFAVEALDPDNGTELGWRVQWDGVDDAETNSHDVIGGFALDPASGRVFVAGTDGSEIEEIVVIAWDPPSTRSAWLVRPVPGDGLDQVADMQLTASGKLVVLYRHTVENDETRSHMFALQPEDGGLIWSAALANLGFETDVPRAIDMVATPDGGVAVSGYVPWDSNSGLYKGFLLRLDADLDVHCLGVADLGLTEPHILMDVAVASTGDIYAGGWTVVPGVTDWDHRALVVRWE